MADFESIIRKHVTEDGNIPTSAINAIVTAIKTAVGNEYVDKERYKAKLTEIDTLKERQQTAEDNATTAEKWKTKYDAIKAELDEFKATTAAKESHDKKANAFRNLLREVGVAGSNERIEKILGMSDVDGLEFDKDGNVKGADKLKESIKSEWADFIQTTEVRGARTPTPPSGMSGATMTRADLYKKDDKGRFVMDASERQKALSEIIAAEQQKG